MVSWLLNCSMAMELVFAIITFLVALYAFKIYRITYQNEHKLFSAGFLSISLSYLVWFVMNIVAAEKLENSVYVFQAVNALNLFTIGAYVHMVLFLIGLSTLAYITMKSDNPKYLALLMPISIIPIFVATNGAITFYSIAIIFLLYLALHYILEYKERKNAHLLIMFLSFLTLSIGTYVLTLSTANYRSYVIGHAISFVAYLLILLNLLLTLKHGKKKK